MAASPATATTDFLAPDILSKCGRAVPALNHALGRTRWSSHSGRCRAARNSEWSADVRFGAHSGLKSDITCRPGM